MSTAELNLRDEDETSVVSGDLPEQGGSATPTIMPGIHMFRLPSNISQCWGTFDVKKKDANGNVLVHPQGTTINGVDVSGQPITEQHLMLKFNKDNPLIVVDPGGELDGLPAGTVTINTMGRRRGKKGDLDAPVVSDMTYLKVKSLRDNSPVLKKKDWLPVMNKHAGAVVRLEHGLRGSCDADRVRYIPDPSDESGMKAMADPQGTMGCGKKYYTSAFKVAGGGFSDQINCECGARVRGFFDIERFLEPIGS